LQGCDVVVLTEAAAHDAGALLATSKTSDVVDAVVAIEASRRSASIVTGDRADLAHLVDTLRADLDIIDV
jgi:hypothetical protein